MSNRRSCHALLASAMFCSGLFSATGAVADRSLLDETQLVPIHERARGASTDPYLDDLYEPVAILESEDSVQVSGDEVSRPEVIHQAVAVSGNDSLLLTANPLIEIIESLASDSSFNEPFDHWYVVDVDVADHDRYQTRVDEQGVDRVALSGVHVERNWQYSASKSMLFVDFHVFRNSAAPGQTSDDTELQAAVNIRDLLSYRVGAARDVVVATAD